MKEPFVVYYFIGIFKNLIKQWFLKRNPFDTKLFDE